MYPKDYSAQPPHPSMPPAPGGQLPGASHQAPAGTTYSGHTIGMVSGNSQIMSPPPGASFQPPAQRSITPAAPYATTASEAGMRAYEQGPEVFTKEQWDGIRTVLGGPMQGSLWLAYRLASLSEYELDFIIDNSVSMNKYDGMRDPETNSPMTRLQEAIYRLGNIAELLSYIPVKGITLRNLSDNHVPEIINCQAPPPQEISNQIKGYLNRVYLSPRSPTTPLYTALLASIQENVSSSNPRIIYVLNDGQPNGRGNSSDVCNLLERGRIHEKNPVCLIACTDDEDSIGWMNSADSIGSVHVVDDYESEKRGIQAKQGQGFPVTEGFYAMSSLLGAIDRLFDYADENYIYSHKDYQEILGRKVTPAEYEKYRSEAEWLQRQSGRFGGSGSGYRTQHTGQYPGSHSCFSSF